jgi:hypothetical protein
MRDQGNVAFGFVAQGEQATSHAIRLGINGQPGVTLQGMEGMVGSSVKYRLSRRCCL